MTTFPVDVNTRARTRGEVEKCKHHLPVAPGSQSSYRGEVTPGSGKYGIGVSQIDQSLARKGGHEVEPPGSGVLYFQAIENSTSQSI